MENMRFESVWRVLKNYNFEINEINDDLICTICKRIMINACNAPCGCRYCSECLKTYLDRKEKICPGELNDCNDVLIDFDRNVHIDQPINVRISQLRIKCPEQCCAFMVELKEMEDHIRVCNKQRRSCPFINVGCVENNLVDNNMKQHLLSEIHSHSTLLIQWIENLKNEIDTLKINVNKIKTENKKKFLQRSTDFIKENGTILHVILIFILCFSFLNFGINNTTVKEILVGNNKQIEISELQIKIEQIFEKLKIFEKKYETLNENEFVWTIEKFSEKRKDAQTHGVKEIFSDPFISHKNGYKLILQMDPDGTSDSKSTHLSVYFCIMKGKFDDYLQWPFKYDITLNLINQHTNSVHVSRLATYDQLPNSPNWNKPTSFRNIGIGFPKLISFHELETKPGLIHDDKVVIKCTVHVPQINTINEQQIYRNKFVWIIEGFSQKRIDAQLGKVEGIFSDPFFTNKNGYKLIMQMDPNGYGEAKNLYLSVFFCIMKGNFDDKLEWPFKSNVTFDLINQHTNKAYLTAQFTNESLPNHPNRNKPIAERNFGLGYPKFISLKELTKNFGLIHNDKIVIEITTHVSQKSLENH